MKELEAAITPKTRAIVLNTPHNPTGKVSMLCDVYDGGSLHSSSLLRNSAETRLLFLQGFHH